MTTTACNNCGQTYNLEPPMYCRRCNARFMPADPAKFHPTEAEDQLLDDIIRTEDKVLFSHVVGQTACPHDCEVGALERCKHGYLSLGMRAGFTEWK